MLILLVPKVVATVNGVVTSALGGSLFNFFYYNCGSDCVIIPYRRYYNRCVNGLGI